MQRYRYDGFGSDGLKARGEVDANSIADARRLLGLRGIRLISVAPGGRPSRRLLRGLRFHSVRLNPAKLFRELAILTSAGLTLDQSAKAILSAATEPKAKETLGSIVGRLSGGADAANAFSLLEGLPADCLALITSGERSGRMADVLATIAADLEARDKQRKELLDAMVYPAFLLLMMVGALGMITFVLVPALVPIFESANRSPPLMIVILERLRQMLTDPLAVFGFALLTMLVAVYWSFNQARRHHHLEALILRLPLVGAVRRETALSRYLLSLALLMQNAVPVNEALALAAACCPVRAFHGPLNLVRDRVSTGARLHAALQDSNLFPPGVLALATVGEEVNRLPVTLANAGTVMREEAKRTAERLLAMLTPAITIVLGALVGALVISVMTALLSINELST